MYERARPSSCRSSGKRDVATPTDDTHDDAMEQTNGPQGLVTQAWAALAGPTCSAGSRRGYLLDLGSLGPWEASADRASYYG